MPIGIVALSFAKRAKEPNPVNLALAEATISAISWVRGRRKKVLTVAQWEIARDLRHYPCVVVSPADATGVTRAGKPYLDSQDVLNKAFSEFKAHSVTDVIVIANPFLHLQLVKRTVRAAGFNVLKFKVPRVGFDDSHLNLQWWGKGPIRFVTYLAIQAIGEVTGQNFHGIGEKSPPNKKSPRPR